MELLPVFPLFILPSLGLPELVIIVVVVLIIFGPGKLPNVFRAVGDGMRQFREASDGVKKELTQAPPASAIETHSDQPHS